MQDVQRHYPYLVCCIADKVVGFAFAGRSRPHEAYNWNAETSIYISPDHQGRGIATALYTALLQLLRLQGYCNVYAIITLPNDASVALHKHFGFNELTLMRQGGFKLGQWRDVLWMEYRIPNCCDPNSHGRPIRPDELNQNDVDTSLAMATALLSGAQ
jgi:phosphinothricin acetyltransferase